jgi:hypothetical protein
VCLIAANSTAKLLALKMHFFSKTITATEPHHHSIPIVVATAVRRIFLLNDLCPLDQVANFIKVIVQQGYGTTDTNVQLATGQGASY